MTFEPATLELRGPVHGKCERILPLLADCSVDAVVTDPPYGIRFMGKAWDRPSIEAEHQQEQAAELVRRREGRGVFRLTGDRDRPENRKMIERTGSAFASRAGVAGSYDFTRAGMLAFQAWCEAWGAEALRVLKPGGHAVVFGYGRTYHRLVTGLEDAGFEIRDTLLWLFGQGFPKSHNLLDDEGEKNGWGTALKPSFEPIVLARKPFKGSVGRCFREHGTGALHIDACRIAGEQGDGNWTGRDLTDSGWVIRNRDPEHPKSEHEGGRWPATLILDEAAAALLDEEVGELVSGANPTRRNSDKFRNTFGAFEGQRECVPARGKDVGGPSRFFYCGKTRPEERHAGVDRERFPDGNDHPTVKPIEVMRWLLRLTVPAGGLVLDPFLGSGTTGCAAALEGMQFIGVDEDEHYLAIAEQRIEHWAAGPPQLELAS